MFNLKQKQAWESFQSHAACFVFSLGNMPIVHVLLKMTVMQSY